MPFWVDLAGIFGFFLACIALAWHVYVWRDAKRERAVVTLRMEVGLRFGKHASLVAEIINTGGRPLYMKDVKLERRCEDGKVLSFKFERFGKRNEPLQVHESCEYCLPPVPTVLGQLGQLDADGYEFVVRSTRTELYRKPAVEISGLLRQLAEIYEH